MFAGAFTKMTSEEDKYYRLRLSESEHKDVKLKATREGVTMLEYIRERLGLEVQE